jgi:hypothetical protein
MNPEIVIWKVKFSGLPVTFQNCLAVCGDMRVSAMARFIFRELNGEMISRAECEELFWNEMDESQLYNS